MTTTFARRAFAVLIVAGAATVSLPSLAAVNLLGSIASQERVPAKLASCSASVSGPVFSPNVVFVQQPDPVARYTVTLAFFDKRNVSVGRVDVTDHGSDTYDLPSRADSMTCAISRLTLDDGSVYPASGGGNASAGGVALGVLGAGALVGVVIAVSHGNSSTSNTAAPASSATPTPVPTGTSGATATATATGPATPTATPTAAVSYPPTPSPFPTSPTTAIPTLRPHLEPVPRGPHPGGR